MVSISAPVAANGPQVGSSSMSASPATGAADASISPTDPIVASGPLGEGPAFKAGLDDADHAPFDDLEHMLEADSA
eukprot:5468460-Pyramimonas_sp.AAC.1